MRRLPEELMNRLLKLGHRRRPSPSATVAETSPGMPVAPSTRSSRPIGELQRDIPQESPPRPPVEPGAGDSSAASEIAEETRKRGLHKHWIWPAGLAVAGIGSAATLLLRGCWHTHMSWPMTVDHEFSYQVCTSCGIKRLYDEKTFQAYGPYGYDVDELIARERAYRTKRMKREEERKARLERKAGGRDRAE
jgi:hypothetical protein